MTQVGYGNKLFAQYNVFKPRIASFCPEEVFV